MCFIPFYYVCIRFFRKYMSTDPPRLARLPADQSLKNQIVNSIIYNIIKVEKKRIPTELKWRNDRWANESTPNRDIERLILVANIFS